MARGSVAVLAIGVLAIGVLASGVLASGDCLRARTTSFERCEPSAPICR